MFFSIFKRNLTERPALPNTYPLVKDLKSMVTATQAEKELEMYRLETARLWEAIKGLRQNIVELNNGLRRRPETKTDLALAFLAGEDGGIAASVTFKRYCNTLGSKYFYQHLKSRGLVWNPQPEMWELTQVGWDRVAKFGFIKNT